MSYSIDFYIAVPTKHPAYKRIDKAVRQFGDLVSIETRFVEQHGDVVFYTVVDLRTDDDNYDMLKDLVQNAATTNTRNGSVVDYAIIGEFTEDVHLAFAGLLKYTRTITPTPSGVPVPMPKRKTPGVYAVNVSVTVSKTVYVTANCNEQASEKALAYISENTPAYMKPMIKHQHWKNTSPMLMTTKRSKFKSFLDMNEENAGK